MDTGPAAAVVPIARRRLSRRRTLQGLGGGALSLLGASRAPSLVRAAEPPPNILVIVVDEMRDPLWFPPLADLDAQLPALARLRNGAVRFAQHYTASNACTPARACLLTGLYTHQTGVMLTLGIQASADPGARFTGSTPAAGVTGASHPSTVDLDPRFPTWGHLLRQQGYETSWYGKWHLSACGLEPYGFAGGTCPSPDGGPGQGLAKDPDIADQAIDWLQSQGGHGPWCTTVSLVNPHDIQWYPRYSDRIAGEDAPPQVFQRLPPNFERATDLLVRGKPRLQLAQIQAINEVFGILPHRGPGFETGWLRMLDLYLQLHTHVDREIGRVLDALAAQPAVAANTVVIFTSDHGDYIGAHGMRGKGGGLYEEGIRVPLWVKDPTGRFAQRPEVVRTQLTSSVDLAPLLLTLASGDDWRSQPEYGHLADRLDLAAVLRDPAARGRPYVLHATDEDGYEFGPLLFPFLRDAPWHVIGLRTPTAKLGLYSHWASGSDEIQPAGEETEYYDYATPEGQQELTNGAGPGNQDYLALHDQLVNDAIPNELRRPLPSNLQPAHEKAIGAYLDTVAADAEAARRGALFRTRPTPTPGGSGNAP